MRSEANKVVLKILGVFGILFILATLLGCLYGVVAFSFVLNMGAMCLGLPFGAMAIFHLYKTRKNKS